MEIITEVAKHVLMETPLDLAQGDLPISVPKLQEEVAAVSRSSHGDADQGFQQVKRKSRKNKEPLGMRNTVRFKVSAPMYTFQS